MKSIVAATPLSEPEIDDVPAQTGRRIVSAPPVDAFAPVRKGVRVEGLAFGAVLSLAGLSFLSGAPPLIVAGLVAASAAGFSSLWRAHRADAAANAAQRAAAAEKRAEIETLADRMWELQESEEHFHGLIDALGDLVVHRDREGRIVFANRVFAELLGQAPDQLRGRKLAELGIEVGVVPDAAFSDGECLSSTDVAIQTATGQRWYSWIELSVRDKSSKAVSHRAIARDITARKRAETALISARERAEFASHAKSRFLATVSHEIRTPMNGIMGMAKLLADTGLSAEQRTYVGAVSTSAAALLALIEDLLDFSRIEAGRFEPEPQPMSPRELAESVVELLAARAFGKGIALAVHIDPDVPHMITADPGRLRQVLLNLVGNAVKFTEQGGVLVSVTRHADPVDTIRFSVADTGPGLRDEDRERIFEEFEQGDGTRTRAHGGAGLGLAISRRILHAMGGTIHVESTHGEGSDFIFELPVVDAVASTQLRGAFLRGHRTAILTSRVIEAEAMALTLRACGDEVDIVSTLDEALALEGSYDVVMVDAASETRDTRTLRLLRKGAFAASHAIVLIGPTERALLADFRGGGYSSFLARPVRGETLLRVIISGANGAEVTQPVRDQAGRARRMAPAGLSVLVAEDNEINAMLARATLQKGGHRVEVVGNGKAAVDAVCGTQARNRFDIVLMDLHMPTMDGLEAIGLIRRHEEDAGLPPVPIMVLSADSHEATRHSVLAHGASGFVSKPIDPEALIRAVEEHGAG